MTRSEKRGLIREHLQEQFGLSAEKAEDLLPGFLKTLQGYLEQVEAAVEAGDPGLLARNAHTLKGALLNLGIEDGAERARVIEALARKGDARSDCVSSVAALRATLAAYLD